MKMCYFFSSFYVSESARLGCVLRPIVHIVYSSFRIDATATLSYVMGDYVFMETPRHLTSASEISCVSIYNTFDSFSNYFYQ